MSDDVIEWRWYARDEEPPVLPCVFADCSKESKTRTFTAIFLDKPNVFEAVQQFIKDGPWTHWHPVSPIPK